MLIFLAAALIAGRLASRLRMQVLALRVANTHATAMQNLGRHLSTAADLGQVIQAGAAALHGTLQAQAWIRINGASGPNAVAQQLGAKDLAAADWTQQHGQASGRYTDTLAGSAWWFLPVRSDQDTLGVVALRFPAAMVRLGFEQRRLAERMVDDIGQAALRARLVSELEAARVAGETERLRSALLSAVSHDLRAPLSSMIGAADSLARYGTAMDAADRHSLLEMIRVEGERLDRYIQNLLDMTRLGHGGLKLARDWVAPADIVASAVQRLRPVLAPLQLELLVPQQLPLLYVHAALIEQALVNVLENAARFSPAQGRLQLAVEADQDELRILVADQGPGIPEAEREKIFDMFYTAARGDRGGQGTGLGLAICQGMVGAHGGRVTVGEGLDGRGACLTLHLPLHPQPQLEDESA